MVGQLEEEAEGADDAEAEPDADPLAVGEAFTVLGAAGELAEPVVHTLEHEVIVTRVVE